MSPLRRGIADKLWATGVPELWILACHDYIPAEEAKPSNAKLPSAPRREKEGEGMKHDIIPAKKYSLSLAWASWLANFDNQPAPEWVWLHRPRAIVVTLTVIDHHFRIPRIPKGTFAFGLFLDGIMWS